MAKSKRLILLYPISRTKMAADSRRFKGMNESFALPRVHGIAGFAFAIVGCGRADRYLLQANAPEKLRVIRRWNGIRKWKLHCAKTQLPGASKPVRKRQRSQEVAEVNREWTHATAVVHEPVGASTGRRRRKKA
jgi:hypothetical protein